MTSVVKANERNSTTGQKFWPLKKFGLNNGKGTEQPISLPPSSVESKHDSVTSTTATTVTAASSNAASVANEMEKKSKNKRLSSLLSSRRQGTIQNLQSHENTPEAIAADNTTKKYSSQTSTINRKAGREIRNRTQQQQQQQQQRYNTIHLTAKSAGSGTLTRTTSVFNNKQQQYQQQQQRASKLNIRRSSDDKPTAKPNSRPQSPPTKRNDSPLPSVLSEQQREDKIIKKVATMDESKKNIEEEKPEASTHESKKIFGPTVEDTSTKKEMVLEKKPEEKNDEEEQIPSISTSTSTSSSASSIHYQQVQVQDDQKQQLQKTNSPVPITEFAPEVLVERQKNQYNEENDNNNDNSDNDNEFDFEESQIINNQSELVKEHNIQLLPSLPSPPNTPAAVQPFQQQQQRRRQQKSIVSTLENSYTTKEREEVEEDEEEDEEGGYFDEEFEEVEVEDDDDEGEQQYHYHQHQHQYHQQQYQQRQQQQQQQQYHHHHHHHHNTSGANIYSEPASPTLYTFDAQLVQTRPYETDKLQPIQRIQRLRPAASFATLRQLANHNGNQNQFNQLKKRPVSFIESTVVATATATNANHASVAASAAAASSSLAADDYLTVRPRYNRRASHEDQSHHIRQQSDNTIHHRLSSPPLAAANTATQLGPSSRRLVRSNTVQAIRNVIIKDGQGHRIVKCVGLDQSPPLQPQQRLRRKKIASFESNDSFFSDTGSSTCWTNHPQSEYDFNQSYQPQLQYLQQQQQQQQQQSQQQQQFDDTSSSDSGSQRCKRRIKRRDSARSLNSLCSHHHLTASFETAKCEQLQNKLEKERATVKVLQKQKEACNKDISFLSQNIDTLTAENLEWKRKYESEKTSKEKFQDELASTMDNLNEATEQIRQLENKNRALKEEVDQKMMELRELEKRKARTKMVKDSKAGDRLLAAQLQHSQNQVRLLKSTMEQFLRMGVFSDDHLSFVSPTSSIETVVSELRSGRSRHRRTGPPIPSTNKSGKAEEEKLQQQSHQTQQQEKQKQAEASPSSVKKSESGSKQQQQQQPSKQVAEKKEDELTMTELDLRLRELLREKEILQAEYSKAPSSGGNAIVRRRREELESKLDDIDSQMCRIKLRIRNRIV